MTLDARRIAKKVCKRLEVEIAIAVQGRPKAVGGYTQVQGYRTALALCAAGCWQLGMTDEEIVKTIRAALAGVRGEPRPSTPKPD